MTTGALIYLVSACGSGEEFVAAFRRYADRNGLFIPIAEPLAAGRRGRFAVALKDGGVMIEGDAEVVGSARTPSVLHGRVGMTLRFVGPDEPSKIVLVELEKARLSMRPPPPSVPPRPAEVPPAPRPVPPAPAGRIDATNALAECVAIGDVDALEVVEKGGPPPKAGPRFVVPSIPPIAAKPAPAPAPEPAVATLYDADVELPTLTRPIEPEVEVASRESLTALDVRVTDPSISVPPGPPTDPSISVPPGPLTPPSIPVPPVRRTPPSIPVPRNATPLPAMPALTRPPSAEIAAPLPPPPAPPPPVPAPPLVGAPPTAEDPLGDVEISGEPTDLTTIPLEPLEPAPRDEPPAAAARAEAPRPPVVGAPSAAPVRPPNIEEPTPSGDWTMVPGADGPTIQPRSTPRSPAPSAGGARSDPPAPSRRLSSEPMPVVTSTHPLESEPKRPPADLLGFSEPKVQVDPTLIEPLVPVAEPPAAPRTHGSQPQLEHAMAASSSSGMRRQDLLTPVPGFMPPYPAYPMDPNQAAAPFPPHGADGTGGVPDPRARYSSGAILPVRPRRTRAIVIAASAVVVLAAAAIALVIGLGGDERPGETAPRPAAATTPPADAAAPLAPDAAAHVPDESDGPPDVASAPPEAGSAAAAPGASGEQCAFNVTTTPPGAEVLLDRTEVVGTTPAKLSMPCGVEIRLSFKRPRFVTAERKYTPTPAGKPLKVTLARPTYLVKVSSTPSGATVTIGGRAQGVTPTTIRVPVGETSTLTLWKEGFATDTQRIAPKQNNQSVHVTLRRAPRRVPR